MISFDFMRSAAAIVCMSTAGFVMAIDSFSSYETAEFYHNNSTQQWNVAYESLNAHTFLGNESVIEIGCRGGKVAANIAGRVPQGLVVATEMRGPGAIEFATRNYSKALYPNLSFLEQDFLDSNYIDQFDLAVSFSSLHWFSDQTIILKKIHQALKTEGTILFTIPCKPTAEITACFTELTNMVEWQPYFKTYSHPRKKWTADEYKSLLADVGFRCIDVRVQQCKHAFENKRALIDWFSAFSPTLDAIPQDKKDNFLSDFANLYVKYFPTGTDGQIPFVQDELVVKAIK